MYFRAFQMILEDSENFGWLRLTLVNSWSNLVKPIKSELPRPLGGPGGWRFQSIFFKNTFKTFSNDKEWFLGFWANFGGSGALRGILVIFINLFSSWKLSTIVEDMIFSNHWDLICLWPPKFSSCQNGVSTAFCRLFQNSAMKRKPRSDTIVTGTPCNRIIYWI